MLPDNSVTIRCRTAPFAACVRGRNMRQRIYNPDRIKKPLKRVEGAKRSDGKFEEISWEEAIDLVAKKLKYTYDTYGPEAVFKSYGSGVWNAHLGSSGGWARLLNLMGGSLGYYGNYSYLQISQITRYFYGALDEQPSNPSRIRSRTPSCWCCGEQPTGNANVRRRHHVHQVLVLMRE